MHPAILEWWHQRRVASGCGDGASCGPGPGRRGWGGGGHGPSWGHGGGGGDIGDGDGDGGGWSFGVRRPLRFLAYKLDLDEKQVAELARILDELKTERAQAEVDRRRTVAALADAVAGDSFDGERAREGTQLRVESSERVRGAVVKALGQIHGLLNADQRGKLAYLIRTGTLLI